MSKRFSAIATAAAHATGHWLAFAVAVGVVFTWIVTGPIFGFSDTWQLVINTGTTIVTFMLLFLVQNSQVSGDEAVHLKLDEVLLALEQTNNRLVGIERETDEEVRHRIMRQHERDATDGHSSFDTSRAPGASP